ncbi:MAG: hypothetical protein ACPG31_09855 [Planctomycetota bacterium]
MKGWTSLVVLAAVLISAAAWWVESTREEEPEKAAEQSAAVAQDGPMDARVGVSEDATAEEAGVAAPADDATSSVLSREPAAPLEVPFEGAYVEMELSALLTTASYHGAQRFTDGPVDVFYILGDFNTLTPIPEDAPRIGQLTPGADGHATTVLPLAVDEEGKLLEAALAFRAVQPGWMDGRIGESGEAPGWTKTPIRPEYESLNPLHISIRSGVEIPIRGLGLSQDDRYSWTDRVLALRYRNLDMEGSEWIQSIQFNHQWTDILGFIPLEKRGRYQFRFEIPEGVGFIRSMNLDPANPPSEITMLIQEYGSLSGRIHSSRIDSLPRMYVKAIHESLVPSALSDILPDDPESFPLRTRWAETDHDGRFSIHGLAPGTYRLAWSESKDDGDQNGFWFEMDSVPTGTHDLELEVPVSMLELRLVNAQGVIQPLYGKARPEVVVTKVPLNVHQGPSEIQPSFTNETQGYPLLEGNRYQVQVWSEKLGLFQTELAGPYPPEGMVVDIPNEAIAAGLLKWSGPEENILYEVLTEELGQEIYYWTSNPYHRVPIRLPHVGLNETSELPLETRLPPGKYLMRAKGVMDDSQKRPPWGSVEQWIEIRSNETTTVEFDLPKVGWLLLSLRSTSFAEPDLPRHSRWDEIDGLDKRSKQVSNDPPTFTLRPKDGGNPVALSFPSDSNGFTQFFTPHFHPGQSGAEAVPAQVFLPGEYILETRVFGYPLVTQEVTIVAGERNDVSVVIQNP